MFVSADVPNETALIDPLNCRELLDPEITIASAPYLPILTVLSANASITGKPAIVFTENKESDKSSDTENNLPLFPSIENKSVLPTDPEPKRVRDPEGSCVSFSIKFNELVKLIIAFPGTILISGILLS